MHTRIETITPDKAREYLGKNLHNRSLRQGLVKHLATEIANGNWIVTHQGIAFDERGNLIDGQHRLNAVIAANVPIEIQVSRAVTANGHDFLAQDVIDCGARRSTADQLALCHGVTAANMVASSARWIVGLCMNGNASTLSVANAQKVLSIYQDEIYAVSGPVSQLPLFRKSWIIGSLAFAAKAYREEIVEIAGKLGSGEDLVKSDAVMVLRNWLISMKAQTARGDKGAREQFFNGLYHSLTGNSISKLAVGARGFDHFVNKQRKHIETVRAMFGVEKAFTVKSTITKRVGAGK